MSTTLHPPTCICTRCEKTAATEVGRQLTIKEQKWAAKHKCRRCGRGLPLTRYFDCTRCVPHDTRPSDDIYIEMASACSSFHYNELSSEGCGEVVGAVPNA